MYKFQLFDTTQTNSPIAESDDLVELCEDLEYGDVAEGKYIIVDKNTETKYALAADRVVNQKDYYSVSNTSAGTVWQPVLGDKI